MAELPKNLTPMMQQYQAIKKDYPETILFFRLGDFYEMFGQDAEVASRVLEITLTGRGPKDKRVPMCGIPYHAGEGYLAKLLDKGYKVAICEQVEDPREAKGVVKREVIKVITPGTILEGALLPQKSNNYLLALAFGKEDYGLAYVDISTGEFKATKIPKDQRSKLWDEILRIHPAETLVPDIFPEEEKETLEFLNNHQISITRYRDIYDGEVAQRTLSEYFKIRSLEGFGFKGADTSLASASAIIDYLKETQKSALDQINRIQPYHTGDFMFLDSATRRNLEITQTIRDKSFRGSLLWVLDHTQTPMGGRCLRRWILQPLLNPKQINLRLDAVAELFQGDILRSQLRELLKGIFDIERLTSKVASAAANARDLVALKESLLKLPQIKEALRNTKSSKLKEIRETSNLEEVVNLIDRAIVDDPPFVLREGNLIKEGFHAALDELKSLTSSGKDWILKLEDQERRGTGIKSLKVGFTKVFGYYIEVTTSNLPLVPPHYIRKQTLVNAERFITPELKEKEALILNAEERMIELEYSIFTEVRSQVASYVKELQRIAGILGEIDVLLSLAEIAVDGHYVRPEISKEEGQIVIRDGRHPVVEKVQGGFCFVPNHAFMDNKENRFLIITGPNMAGKSTYMRQIALITLMAHLGSFVPASSAKISLVDRIFTRVGAFDDLYAGQSTFMLEMTETASILNSATHKSLIILDEIGRGTSTFDGMSIAAAVAEYIHQKIGAKTLFATHYHELTQLSLNHREMKNYNTLVKEEGDHITFLYRIVPGVGNRSYGIQVAKLAGLPKGVIERAKEVYSKLEMVEDGLSQKSSKERAKKVKPVREKDQLGLFA